MLVFQFRLQSFLKFNFIFYILNLITLNVARTMICEFQKEIFMRLLVVLNSIYNGLILCIIMSLSQKSYYKVKKYDVGMFKIKTIFPNSINKTYFVVTSTFYQWILIFRFCESTNLIGKKNQYKKLLKH